MKIVYYLPSLYAPGGLERVITFKANYFADNFADYSVTIITSEQVGKKPHFALSPNVKHIDLGISFDYPFNQKKLEKIIKYPFRYYKFKSRLTKTLKELKADIVISTLRRELNFIHSIHDGSIKIGEFHVTRHSYHVGPLNTGNFLQRLLKRKLSNLWVSNLQKLSKVILLTHEETGFWPELNNTTVIPNPIITPIPNQTNNYDLKQVIAVGRYAPQKGFDLLINSWAIVSKKHPSWILRIYGEGMRQELQDQIDKLSLNKNCILEHTVNNIADKYSESSIFVLSSRFEGFGMVITEAMACGIPPVSFACPCGPRDIIKDEINGLLVDNGNIEALAEKIIYLIENKELREKLGTQARISSEQYRIKNIAAQWNELFYSLLEKNKENEN